MSAARSRAAETAPAVAPRDRGLRVALLLALHVSLLLAHQPLLGTMTAPGTFTHGDQGIEIGMTNYGDFQLYYRFAQLGDQGKLAYRDYWFGYPPLFPVLNQGVYQLSQGMGRGYNSYANAMSFVMAACNVGTLILLESLAAVLHGPVTAALLGWVYLALSAPLVFSFWDIEPLVAFLVLLATWSLVRGRDLLGGAAIAAGALTKFVPLVLLGAAWRLGDRARSLRVTAIGLGVTAIVLGAVVALAPRFGPPSLTAQFHKASHETIWALIDGNYRTGLLDPDPFDPAAAARLQGHPPRIPSLLRLLPFAAIGLWIFLRARQRDGRSLVAFVTVTFAIFFLWAQAWSPQWQVILTPLLLLCFPSRVGILLCATLALVNFVEFPLLFTRFVDETRTLRPEARPALAITILLRTVALGAVAWVLARRLTRIDPTASAARTR
jgi:hypothetical protein